jgi:hypothetical protein
MAVVEGLPPPLTATVGVDVYPDPSFVIVTDEMPKTTVPPPDDPPPPLMFTVGTLVYPVPLETIVKAVIAPPETVAVNTAPVPPPPVTLTVGALEYPLPPVTATVEIPTVAVAAAPEPPPPEKERVGGEVYATPLVWMRSDLILSSPIKTFVSLLKNRFSDIIFLLYCLEKTGL